MDVKDMAGIPSNGDVLGGLKTGDSATVVSIVPDVRSAKRLADLGFVRGASVTMVSTGRPCIVRIQGRCVGLGHAHQESIALSTAK